jgi:hypothetical protein
VRESDLPGERMARLYFAATLAVSDSVVRLAGSVHGAGCGGEGETDLSPWSLTNVANRHSRTKTK